MDNEQALDARVNGSFSGPFNGVNFVNLDMKQLRRLAKKKDLRDLNHRVKSIDDLSDAQRQQLLSSGVQLTKKHCSELLVFEGNKNLYLFSKDEPNCNPNQYDGGLGKLTKQRIGKNSHVYFIAGPTNPKSENPDNIVEIPRSDFDGSIRLNGLPQPLSIDNLFDGVSREIVFNAGTKKMEIPEGHHYEHLASRYE